MLVDFAITTPPFIKLAARDIERPDEPVGSDVGLL